MVGAIEETRPFAARHAVGNGFTVRADRIEGKIGQFIVEQIAVCHQPRAERVFNRSRHGHDVAVFIHNHQMAGGRQLYRHTLRVFLAKLTRLNVFQRLCRLGGFLQHAVSDKLAKSSSGRDVDKRGIADVMISVGKRNP